MRVLSSSISAQVRTGMYQSEIELIVVSRSATPIDLTYAGHDLFMDQIQNDMECTSHGIVVTESIFCCDVREQVNSVDNGSRALPVHLVCFDDAS